jgi:group I intron endonuclease
MIIYKTLNLVNGKFYVGKYMGRKPHYLGSGILLNRAIEKYGRENFIRRTLQICYTKEELIQAEIKWIKDLNATNRKIAYNIAPGGYGGYLYKAKGKEHSQYGKGYLHEGKRNGMFGKKHSPETIKKIKEHPNRIHIGKENGNYGKGLFGKDNGLSVQIVAINRFTNKVIDVFESRRETILKMKVTEWSLDRILKNEKTHYHDIYYELI